MVIPVNNVLEAANDLFSLVATVRQPNLNILIEEKFYADVIEQFNQFSITLQMQDVDEYTINKAKFALASYIDELVLLSNWNGRKAWMSKTLQWKYFNEHLAGERFFDRLTEIRQAGETQARLLELYYVCMQLGFTGVYRLKGQEARQALLVSIKAQLDNYQKNQNRLLSDSDVLQGNFLRRLSQQIPYWSITCVTTALLFFTYTGFTIAIKSHAQSTVKQLQQYEIQLREI